MAPGLAVPGQRLAVHFGHRRHEPHVPHERPDVGVSARLGGGPVHVAAVEDGTGEIVEQLLARKHVKRFTRARPSGGNTPQRLSGHGGLPRSSYVPGRFIWRVSRTSARCAALRAASAWAFPASSASSLYEIAHLHAPDDRPHARRA